MRLRSYLQKRIVGSSYDPLANRLSRNASASQESYHFSGNMFHFSISPQLEAVIQYAFDTSSLDPLPIFDREAAVKRTAQLHFGSIMYGNPAEIPSQNLSKISALPFNFASSYSAICYCSFG